jgi:nucleoside 2-deoxyribosyltransferase
VSRRRCYVASPLGFTDAGREYYTQTLIPALARVVDPIDPWSLAQAKEIETAAALGQQRDLWLEIGRRNAEAIDSCELLAAVLDGQEVDSGTAAEVGYACAKGLTCFGLRTDLRLSGEPKMSVNLQVEYFIERSGGRIVGGLGELAAVLAAA